MNIQDKHMQFVNSLASYLDNGLMPFPEHLTNLAAIKDACNHLLGDQTIMPSTFHHVMKTICGRNFDSWRSGGATWDSAANVAIYFLNNHKVREDGKPVFRVGIHWRKAYEAA
ncbi:hypothetical protein F9K97_16490 [Brucella anthropi]|uniref:hypothetical protein n=1 Tax=Brucella anthropi TaxID=529 RepID=UPI00124EDF64|nr:hypothetical protein [Brucella anthropi]KAB2784573.1 hypothetical protein F9K97_16490 [Brucella anthropi]